MKATFLLGSGISIPAELPSVGALARAILSGDGLVIEPDGSVVEERVLASHWVEESERSYDRGRPREGPTHSAPSRQAEGPDELPICGNRTALSQLRRLGLLGRPNQ
jgi:hypothetical protein